MKGEWRGRKTIKKRTKREGKEGRILNDEGELDFRTISQNLEKDICYWHSWIYR